MSKAVPGARESVLARVPRDSGKRKAGSERGWLFGPWLDIAIGCGACTVPLMLLASPFRLTSALSIDAIFYVLVLLFNYPHYMATIERAYRTRQDLYGRRIVTIHITGLALAAILVAHVFPRVLPWLYSAFLTWSPFHFMAQNFGLTTMFVQRSGAKPRRRDRNLLYFAFLVSYAMVFLSLHARHSPDPYVIALGLPVAAGRYLRFLLAPVFLLTGAVALRGIAGSVPEDSKWKTMIPCVALFSTEFLWFVLPPLLEASNRWEISPQRYAGGLLAVLHSVQYLWIAWYCARRDARTGESAGFPAFNGWAYFALLVVGGIALFVPGPWIASRLLHLDYTSSSLALISIVNLHHFFLDSSIWKMRDRRAGLLPGSSGPSPVGKEEGRGTLGDILDWLRSDTVAARRFRRFATVALLALALLDQVKYALGSDTRKLSHLQRAAALDPYDSSVWLNIASAQAKDKQTDEAIAALRRAVEVNPHRFDAQRALALYYMDNQRYAEADAQYERMTHYFALDANSWMNFGVLESQRDRRSQAVADWKRAEQLDPQNLEVQLYLGEASYDQGQDQEAINHYERYVTLLPKTVPAKQIDHRTLGLSCMKLGTSYEHMNRIERAQFYYQESALVFQEIGETSLESVARMRLAGTLDRLKRRKDALLNFEAALALDKDSGNDPTAGADWFIYAKFLQEIGAPPRFVLTAYLESERLLGDKAQPGPREELEKTIGREAENVHKELGEWVHAALSYKMP
jgi:tetratricopeptide (TPR) repeat protein